MLAGLVILAVNKLLNQQGYQTIVYDSLIYGHAEAVKWGEFINGDLNNTQKLREVFANNEITAVMHFAAFAYVGESVVEPENTI